MAGLADLVSTQNLTAPDPGPGITNIDPKAVEAPISQGAAPVDGKHHGFAGFARDVLGTLGDFLLTRLHMPAMYAPAQHQRQLDEASAGFQDDPLAAAARVGHVDFAAGQKMYDTFADNQRLQALQASNIEARAARMQAAQDAVAAKTRNTAAAYLGSLDREADPTKKAAIYASIRPQLLALGAKNHVDFTDELPEAYNEDVVGAFMNGGVPLGRQRGQEITQDRNDNANQRAIDRNDTANRGITVRAQTAANGQAITSNNNAVTHNDRVTGMNLTASARAAALKERQGHHANQDNARANQFRDGDVRTDANGDTWVWNAKTHLPEKVAKP